MKKIILCLVFVFATSTSLLNANEPKINKEKNLNIIQIEYFGCLTDAYNSANKLEAASEGGAYSWSIDTWSVIFNYLFEMCDEGKDIISITDDIVKN